MKGKRRTMKENCRNILKDSIRKRVDFSRTALSRDLPAPPGQKPPPAGARISGRRG
jgi:hypothetical protein